MKTIFTILFCFALINCSNLDNTKGSQELIIKYKEFTSSTNSLIIGRVMNDFQVDGSVSYAFVVISGKNSIDSVYADVDGNFKFENLTSGSYTLGVKAIGFKNFKSDSLILNNGELNVIRVKLKEIYIKPNE